MAIDCAACSDLKELSPTFAREGITTTICNSLKNDTGINPNLSVLHNDCTDLNLINDCLVGQMQDEVQKYEVCDWKKFMRRFIPNVRETFKGVICAICGLWTNIHNLWDEVNDLKDRVSDLETAVGNIWDAIEDIQEAARYRSYDGILTLYTDTPIYGTGGQSPQVLAFNTTVREGNLPSSVLQVKSGYDGIVVTNTLPVPVLVTATFNCSIATDQNIACCYIVVTRDGTAVGQTPFITPHSYDQQVMTKPFVLRPNQSAEMSYYFAIGTKNGWFISEFGYATGQAGDGTQCLLEATTSTALRDQPSYFSVEARSFLVEES